MFTRTHRWVGTKFRRFRRDQSGATAVEYVMIACGVAAVIAATVFALGSTLQGFYSGALAGMR